MYYEMKNTTIDYYNKNAEYYYQTTYEVDFSATYDRFLQYIPDGGRIIDIGCGSGRDAAAFAAKGYKAVGLDASEEMAKIVEENTGIQVITCDMTSWIAEKPFDGIWCCASLLHLHDDELYRFFLNLNHNMKQGGAIFISVKSGIETGIDDKGRYMKNFTESEVAGLLELAGIKMVEQWVTRDLLSRDDFFWLNVIGLRF